jgi:AcrR family transcriptional regulator
MASPLSPSVPPGPPPLHWVKPPQQARSQKTFERVLDAAEEVIAERGVAALTVSEVVRRAGSSVGAFYARFPDKDALLATLHERSCEEAVATAELALDPKRWESADLPSAVSEVVRFTAALCRERRGILLAFITMAATDATYAERRARLEARLSDLLHAFLLSREGEVTHPDLRVAADTAIRMILGTLEYGAMIHRTTTEDAGPSDERISTELSLAVLRYVGSAVSGGRATRDTA